MYSGRTQREQDVDFVLPIAERQIMFSEDECLQAGYGGFDPSIMTEEALKEVELNYLTRMDESVSQITDEYPVVKYYSENTENLNRFVESITVAVISGTRLTFDEKFGAIEEILDDETVAYITNPFNVSTEIYYHDLCKLLYQKPELTVTNEGVLLFYTPTTLFATLDCKSGNIMGVEELADAIDLQHVEEIVSIKVDDDGDTMLTLKTKTGRTVKRKLTMLFDFFSEGGVTVRID